METLAVAALLAIGNVVAVIVLAVWCAIDEYRQEKAYRLNRI